MSDIAIKLENISKQYRLGTVGTNSMKADMQSWWYRMRGIEDKNLKIGHENALADAGGEYVWALRDINLEVKKGEILGIIGKNGAGKSTLLKLLSRVTGPSTGQIKVNGRIASLLEVGTGFHGELTGRENIFLNGSILGMTKKEIQRQLEDIVEFAGIAKYIDTPVKRYSSGMYVRLGFAVAAHLNPDILIVDEVLAVGDAEFQKKAIGKMKEISQGGGRTVLFVSHNMASIQKLCSKVVVLRKGEIDYIGEIKQGIERYLVSEKEQSINLNAKSNVKELKRIKSYGEFIKILNIKILNGANEATNNLLFTENYKIEVIIEAFKDMTNIDLSIRIDSVHNIPISSIVSGDSNVITDYKKGEIKQFTVELDNFLLTPGSYNLIVTVKSARMPLDRLENVIQFDVSNLTYKTNKPHNELWGLIQIYPKWTIQDI